MGSGAAGDCLGSREVVGKLPFSRFEGQEREPQGGARERFGLCDQSVLELGLCRVEFDWKGHW